ncbi:MAG: hypothetical protein Wins2KO_04270 [Winogradskyella sp.]
MPKLTLNFNKKAERKYEIHLGDCEWLQFKSERYVKEYLSRYKKTLTNNLRILNSYNQILHTTYRQFYFELPLLIVEQIDEFLNTFNEVYNRIFYNFSLGNQNAFVFSNIQKSIVCLSNSAELMYVYAQKHKIYSLLNSITSFRKMIFDFENTLDKDKHDLNISDRPYTSTLNIVDESNEKQLKSS